MEVFAIMKNFLKGLFGLAIIGAVAAGIYYWLSDNKYSDVEDFDDEANDDLQEFLDKEKEGKPDDHYVTLDLTSEKTTEEDKIIGKVDDEDSKVVKADSEESGDVEGFNFSDLTDSDSSKG